MGFWWSLWVSGISVWAGLVGYFGFADFMFSCDLVFGGFLALRLIVALG